MVNNGANDIATMIARDVGKGPSCEVDSEAAASSALSERSQLDNEYDFDDAPTPWQLTGTHESHPLYDARHPTAKPVSMVEPGSVLPGVRHTDGWLHFTTPAGPRYARSSYNAGQWESLGCPIAGRWEARGPVPASFEVSDEAGEIAVLATVGGESVRIPVHPVAAPGYAGPGASEVAFEAEYGGSATAGDGSKASVWLRMAGEGLQFAVGRDGGTPALVESTAERRWSERPLHPGEEVPDAQPAADEDALHPTPPQAGDDWNLLVSDMSEPEKPWTRGSEADAEESRVLHRLRLSCRPDAEAHAVYSSRNDSTEPVGTVPHGHTVDAEKCDDNWLRFEDGAGLRYAKRVLTTGAWLPEKTCPLIGKWEYEHLGKTNTYEIVDAGDAAEFVEQKLRIQLTPSTSPDYTPPPQGEAEQDYEYGGTLASLDRTTSIWFRLASDGLHSLYIKQGHGPMRVVTLSRRIGMNVDRPVSPVPGNNSAGTPGQCGLRNVGNTCFMNSALQCTNACEKLTRYYLSGRYAADINKKNPLGSHGRLAEEYAKLMRAMWSGNHTWVEPSRLKDAITAFAPNFEGYQQHDSHELLSFLLDGLLEDCNKVENKPYYEPLSDEEEAAMSEHDKARLAQTQYDGRHDSEVADLFSFMVKSQLRCNVCESVKSTYNVQTSISLPCQPESQFLSAIRVDFFPADIRAPVTQFFLKLKTTDDQSAIKQEISTRTNVAADDLFLADAYARVADLRRSGKTLAVFEVADADSRQVLKISGPVCNAWHAVGVPKSCKLSVAHEAIVKSLGIEGESLLEEYETDQEIEVDDDEATEVDEELWQAADPCTAHFSLGAGEGTVGTRPISDDEAEPPRLNNGGGAADGLAADAAGGGGGPVKPVKRRKIVRKRVKKQRAIRFERDCWGSPITADGEERLGYHDTDVKLDNDRFMRDVVQDADYAAVEKWKEEEYSVNYRTIEQCLEAYTKEEQLDKINAWHCGKCKEQVRAFKKLEVWDLPTYLIVNFNRFSMTGSHFSIRQKIDSEVRYAEFLDVSTCMARDSPSPRRTRYQLIGVSVHQGSATSGHYTAYSNAGGSWNHYNDNWVSKSTVEEACTPDAYILFYHRVSDSEDLLADTAS
ncbi:Ubiquitin carboxyl-terminal hydrolase 10 [Diplonema papillatum]|nr:Ubiquitin carboxyl-terminal hydrolase 10 [Diplonema papillatum]KAJ9446024.1 Ubiquitin carboxyl-terminal hydrolase 10 [Diplonema papillatum]